MTAITMRLKSGKVYELDSDGYVISRTGGPRGWDYGRGWRIVGFKRRWHSRETVSLADAIAGADIGFGYVVDWDHGTIRQWGSPADDRAVSVVGSIDPPRHTVRTERRRGFQPPWYSVIIWSCSQPIRGPRETTVRQSWNGPAPRGAIYGQCGHMLTIGGAA